MSTNIMDIMSKKSKKRLMSLNNPSIVEIIDTYSKVCKPERITVLDDSAESIEYVKKLSIENGEEQELAVQGHKVHFDGYYDQARDLANTRVMLPEGSKLSQGIKTIDRNKGLEEILSILSGIMKGKEMLVKFYCLGPIGSSFSIPALQITDSAYVIRSEDVLYRQGYEEFKRQAKGKFFHFIHSAGMLKNGICQNIDKRRVYIDPKGERAFAVNSQYAGNSVGLKKLALRLAIQTAQNSGWLCEHMFIMGVKPKGKDRTTYFSGAFPSACGKTSTAMIAEQTIIGDDIAYIKIDKSNTAKAVNAEDGIFGIIQDVNPKDDPIIYEALTKIEEVTFSNVLIKNGQPYWVNMGKDIPEDGVNHSGKWYRGKKDAEEKEIPHSHKNARYTIKINKLRNVDKNADNPDGVPVRAFIYGGRDSNISVPAYQSFNWQHGVFIGATLESETTAAAMGKEGLRKHNPMSIVEFLTVPMGKYIKHHMEFGNKLKNPPIIFSTNYFLKENGKFLNTKTDKKVWLMWMEARVHGEVGGVLTPIGTIPEYKDMARLFMEIFSKEYTREEYIQQFSIRVDGFLEKLTRLEEIFRKEDNIPEELYKEFTEQRSRLVNAEKQYGKKTISPFEMAD